MKLTHPIWVSFCREVCYNGNISFQERTESQMKAVITVVGKDKVGILAKVSQVCAQYDANIIDVNQTVMDDMFCMVMLAVIDKLKTDLGQFRGVLEDLAAENGLRIHVMHQDVFTTMHHV